MMDDEDPSEVKMTLIHGADEIYLPQLLRRRNLLLAGGRIIGILTDAEAAAVSGLPLEIETMDATGCVITPGFVDLHVHITGGGGEVGFASRAPQAKLSELLAAGITTVVGITGTDSVSRSQENLVAKARALNEEGITAFHWAGAYRLPVPTVTGDVQKDVAMLDTCVGVGEVAVADHRGSTPSWQELARIAGDARVGGMLSGKAGLLHLHVGAGAEPFRTLRQATEHSSVPVMQYLPTHCERNDETKWGAVDWVKRGGCVDLTAGRQAREALALLQSKPRPDAVSPELDPADMLHKVTVSSDSYGSYPEYDASGRLLRYRVVKPAALLDFVRSLHREDFVPDKGSECPSSEKATLHPHVLAAVVGLLAVDGDSRSLLRPMEAVAQWSLEHALALVTQNPADRLKLARKGRIMVGADADLLLFLPSDMTLRYVYAKGLLMKTPDWVRGGAFEEGPGIKPHQLGS